MVLTKEFRKAVRKAYKGHALVTDLHGQWRDRVEWPNLDMGSGWHCVLGYVDGEYSRGLQLVWSHFEERNFGKRFSENGHGFNIDWREIGEAYNTLGEAWKLVDAHHRKMGR